LWYNEQIEQMQKIYISGGFIMQTNKNEIPLLIRVLSLLLAVIALVSGISIFLSDNWIYIAILYGSVSIACLLAVIEKTKYNKDKLLAICFTILSLSFLLSFIQTIIRYSSL